jgi:uncharacterized protein YkwD
MSLAALALPTAFLVAPAPAATPTSAAAPECYNSKLRDNHDARACIESPSANTYSVTAYFTNGTDQQLALTINLSLVAGPSTYNLHTCTFTVAPRGNANCEGRRNFSQAPNGPVRGQAKFSFSGTYATLTKTLGGSGAPAPGAPAPGPGDTASTSQALSLVNQERAKAGCAPLRVAAKLQAPAEKQSRDQAARDRDGHDGADGSTIDSRLSGLGYSRWAENVAKWPSAREAVNFWLNSPTHRGNMLNCAFTETGLAVARSNSGQLYWTQTFGG